MTLRQSVIELAHLFVFVNMRPASTPEELIWAHLDGEWLRMVAFYPPVNTQRRTSE